MYILILALLLGLGAWLAFVGHRKRSQPAMVLGGLLVLSGFLLPALLDFWGEMLWFEAVGYGERFWTLVLTQSGTVIGGAAIGAIGVWLVTLPIRTGPPLLRFLPEAAGAAIGGLWGTQTWQEIMLFLNRVTTDMSEPVLGLDTGFYLFVLPLLDSLFWLLLWIVGISLAAALAASLEWSQGGEIRMRKLRDEETERSAFRPVLLIAAILAAVLASRLVLNAFHLLYSPWGVVAGPGWTDIHVRLPAYVIVAVLILILGLIPLLPGVQRRFRDWFGGVTPLKAPVMVGTAAVWIVILTTWFLGLQVAPALTQWLIVEPNEITLEAPYIAHNIRFTRHGFRLHEVEERQFPAAERLTREHLQKNEQTLDNVRLWDWRALDAVYKQFQEIRLYYEFADVDVDRYTVGNDYRQVMVSAREMAQENLPPQSQTFVNRRFKFTHGYGLTLATVSDFTPQGLPNLLVKDIPPQAKFPALAVERPQIYYGELTRTPVVVNSQEKEFDYPKGDENAYIRYPGSGGVQLSNLWRKFVFGWKFDGTQLLLSSYPTPDSRIQFHRQIAERAAMLAPFLAFDEDPYVALVDGRLYWIIDAYTVSGYYPYSQPFSSLEYIEYRNNEGSRQLISRVAPYMEDVNYVRNSVKVIVDAFEGTTDFYVFEPEDPLIQAWRGVFPGLFKGHGEMPAGLRAHVRYPAGLLLAQGLVYAKYHMDEPEVFYNQEDLWVRATEKYYDQVQPVQPYYVMWELPESQQAEFTLILPFTPKNRQVLIGWIAGLCDGENYGRFLAYKFPKEKRVLGPQQVETKIDQNSFLSGQLTLWDQRGSNVIRGNVLAIPIGDTLLYVEPIYLQAETAAYPELRLVVVMHGDTLSYAETFDDALEGLFKEGAPREEIASAASVQELAEQANRAFENYLQLQGEGRFQEAAQELETLQTLLQRLDREESE